MKPDILIRQATIEDLPSILEIYNYHIQHTTVIYHYYQRSLAELKTWFKLQLKNNFPIIVAEFKGYVAGYGTYARFRPHDAYLYCIEHSVYVTPEMQGKGIGKKLILELIDLAKKENYHTMVAGIDAENKFSIEFHQKLGFEKVGYLKQVGYKFDRWLDLVFLQLQL
ncbi:GNAT family N-acetyltransferase [Mesonia aestuariivivens]|uniref:GNAT family N-acetyltransferase n=1 Tax=Mesonia aestuariivivens TaxID=2796128 RepID=A0ABS6VZV8_9FLAO|nr:GNAT family N-acetyltransferase [Mesonia aestuariivivens]MBW2961039.1 GNAT family N-acetyltransferase [Mesonia aestuariivivens]